ncbi:hypothetical protein Ocin01_00502 [Orchesella cincta]|uniref:Uncharacterized protein n=1 Tax=Orchesella cincta TaxID=48709 RepID=A0A1D2NLY7_ORCCI|nr:hypothetical protein Ocin01_00502 [Orchesella cincta]
MATWECMNLRAICLLVTLLDLTAQGWALNCTFKNTYDGFSCAPSSHLADTDDCVSFDDFTSRFYDGFGLAETREKRDAENSPDSKAVAGKVFMCVAQFHLLKENEPSEYESHVATTYLYGGAYGCIYDTKENLKELNMGSCKTLEAGSAQMQMDEFCICNTKDCNNKFSAGFKQMRQIKQKCGQKRYSFLEHGAEEISEDASRNLLGNLILTVALVFVIVLLGN